MPRRWILTRACFSSQRISFAPRLSSHAVFVLDVIGAEERAVLAHWKRLFPAFDQQFVPSKKGAVILRREANEQRLSSLATA